MAIGTGLKAIKPFGSFQIKRPNQFAAHKPIIVKCNSGELLLLFINNVGHRGDKYEVKTAIYNYPIECIDFIILLAFKSTGGNKLHTGHGNATNRV